jgi:hypothetical protein
LTDDITNIEAARARLRALREQRLAEKIENGEIISIPVWIVAGSETEARAQVEKAKAERLAELRGAGDQREVVWSVNMAITGVVRHDEVADQQSEPWKPTAPPYLPRPSSVAARPNEEEEVQTDPEPVIQTYVCVQIGRCHDDDDAGEICEGWFSIDGKVVTVTDAKGGHVGSRAMLKDEDPKTVAKSLLRQKKVPESEAFNRRIYYPASGVA